MKGEGPRFKFLHLRPSMRDVYLLLQLSCYSLMSRRVSLRALEFECPNEVVNDRNLLAPIRHSLFPQVKSLVVNPRNQV